MATLFNMRHPHRSFAVPVPASLLALLGSGVAAQNPGPDLILQDSLVLEETDEHYIGQPLALFVAADGSILVSDSFAETVMHYDANGRLAERLGQRGEGPGEFRQLGGVGFVATDVAGFLDETGKLELFALTTESHPGRVRVDVNNRPSSFAVWRDSLWFAGVNPVSFATYGTVALAELMNGTGDGEQASSILLNRGTAPAPYAENHPLARSLSHAFLDVDDRDVVLGFTASPLLLRTHRLSNAVDTAWIARGSRSGEPDEDELIERMRGAQARSQEELRSSMFDFFASVSFVRDLSRDDSGNVYTLHQDSDRDEEGAMTGVRLYVAVSRFDGDRGCGDTLIPTSDVGVPVPLLQGRTLWILDRRVGRGALPDITTVVRRFTIDATRCSGTVR